MDDFEQRSYRVYKGNGYEYQEEKGKGHGCLGAVLTLFLIVCVILGLLMFSTNVLDGVKNKALSVFYPQKYSEYVTQYSQEFGVSEPLVYAVMRTESGFREEVESHAGAVGLMQLMPETFEWLQNNKDGEVTLYDYDLKNPRVNIEYGTYFLSYLNLRYDGDIELVAAAYNAGITTVDEWLEDKTYSSDGKKLTYIPYEETSKYVKKVVNTYEMYESLYY